MAIALMPPHKVKELLRIYLSKDKPAYPDFLKKLYTWGTAPVKGKYRRIDVFECPDNNLYEGIVGIMKRFNYYAQIEGYTFEVFPLINEADTMKIVQEK